MPQIPQDFFPVPDADNRIRDFIIRKGLADKEQIIRVVIGNQDMPQIFRGCCNGVPAVIGPFEGTLFFYRTHATASCNFWNCGTSSVKQLPFPGWEAARMSPCCRFMNCLEI